MAAVTVLSDKGLIDFLVEEVNKYPAIPRNFSNIKTLTLLAGQLLQQIHGSRGDVMSLKDRTFVVINRSSHWLCERICCGIPFFSDLSDGEMIIKTIGSLIDFWDRYKTTLSRGLQIDLPTINIVQILLKKMNSEVVENLAWLCKASPDFFVKENTYVMPVDDLKAYYEGRRARSRYCIWMQPFASAAKKRDSSDLESVNFLLNNLFMSFEFALSDRSIAQILESWKYVYEFCHQNIAVVHGLSRCISERKHTQKVISEIRKELGRMFAISFSNVGIAPLSGQAHSLTLSAKSHLDQASLWYGWSFVSEMLVNELDKLQQPETIGRIPGSKITQLNRLMKDLVEWEGLMQGFQSFSDVKSVLLGVHIVMEAAAGQSSIIDDRLSAIRNWVERFAEREVQYQDIQEFEKCQRQLVTILQMLISTMEAPLLVYEDSSGLLSRKTADSRKLLLANPIKLSQDVTLPRIPNIGMIDEDSRTEVLFWLETFCFPLKGILAELEKFSISAEEEQSESVFCEAPAASAAAIAVHNKHKKKRAGKEKMVIRQEGIPLSSEQPMPSPILAVKPVPAAIVLEPVSPVLEDLPVSPVEPLPLPSLDLVGKEKEHKETPDEKSKEEVQRQSRVQFDQKADYKKSQKRIQEPVLEEAPPAAPVADIKRKDRDIPRRIEKFRKLKSLLNEYGFRQESGGRHLKFVDGAGGKIPVPRHGNGSLAKGTSAAILSRVRFLSERLDRMIESES